MTLRHRIQTFKAMDIIPKSTIPNDVEWAQATYERHNSFTYVKFFGSYRSQRGRTFKSELVQPWMLQASNVSDHMVSKYKKNDGKSDTVGSRWFM